MYVYVAVLNACIEIQGSVMRCRDLGCHSKCTCKPNNHDNVCKYLTKHGRSTPGRSRHACILLACSCRARTAIWNLIHVHVHILLHRTLHVHVQYVSVQLCAAFLHALPLILKLEPLPITYSCCLTPVVDAFAVREHQIWFPKS